MFEPWWEIPLLLAAGVLGGFINTVAGGASLVALPAMVAVGLPGTVANASNNLATTLAALSAAVGYARRGFAQNRLLAWLFPAAVAGAAVGAGIVVVLPEQVFRRVVAVLMLVALGLVLRKPGAPPPKSHPTDAGFSTRRGVLGAFVFFFLGIYGGFFGGGLGLVVLPLLVLMFDLDFVTANAVKSGLGFGMNAMALAVFTYGGLVAWVEGAILAVGMVAGSAIGVRLAVAKGALWIRGLLVAIAVPAAVYFWLG
jgi:hypothetical protein